MSQTYILIKKCMSNLGSGVIKNGPTPASFSYIFSVFKQTLQFLQQINVKNVHPLYSAGIQTHNLSNMSCHS